MTTIKLKVSEKALGKVLQFLSRFKSDEVQIVGDMAFDMNKKYLVDQHKKMESGQSKLIDLEQAEKNLDDLISKYED